MISKWEGDCKIKKAVITYDLVFRILKKWLMFCLESRKKRIKVDRINFKEVKFDKLKEYDLLTIGGPTRRGVSEPIKGFFEKLEREEIEGNKAVAFYIRVKIRFARSAAQGIEKTLERIKMQIVKHFFSNIKGKRRTA